VMLTACDLRNRAVSVLLAHLGLFEHLLLSSPSDGDRPDAARQ
jgi:hypothetical protein